MPSFFQLKNVYFYLYLSLLSSTEKKIENNRYDKTIKDALSTNGKDVPSGGSGGSGSGGAGSGGSGSGTNSTTSSPGGNTGTDNGGNNGGDDGNGNAGQECFQSKLAVSVQDQALFSRYVLSELLISTV